MAKQKDTKRHLTTKRTLAKMVNVRQAIAQRMGQKGWTAYRLAKAVAGKMTAQTVYDYLAEPQRTRINDEFVGHLLDALELEIVPRKDKP
jgi:Zn-dependent oligopeptidase